MLARSLFACCISFRVMLNDFHSTYFGTQVGCLISMYIHRVEATIKSEAAFLDSQLQHGWEIPESNMAMGNPWKSPKNIEVLME